MRYFTVKICSKEWIESENNEVSKVISTIAFSDEERVDGKERERVLEKIDEWLKDFDRAWNLSSSIMETTGSRQMEEVIPELAYGYLSMAADGIKQANRYYEMAKDGSYLVRSEIPRKYEKAFRDAAKYDWLFSEEQKKVISEQKLTAERNLQEYCRNPEDR